MSAEKMTLTSLGKEANPVEVAAAFKANWDADKRQITAGDVKEKENGRSYTNYQRALINQLEATVNEVNAIRRGDDKNPSIDMSFGEYVQDKFGISKDKKGGFAGLMHFLGLDPSNTTIQKLMTMPDFQSDFTWLVPELIRDAVRTGYLSNPTWESLIASDTNVSSSLIKVPQIKKASTPMARLGEAETIPLGSIQFGQKSVKIFKVGTGIEISDEVRREVSVDLLSEFLGSAGVTLSQGLSTEAVNVLINGDGNGNAAPVIGTEALNAFDYDNDILRTIIRLAALGYRGDSIIANETPARKIMSLPEFKGFSGDKTLGGVTLEAIGIPTQFRTYLSGVMPVATQIMILDTMKALHKYTAAPLMIESERIISSQVTQTYASITTGFSKFMRDASIILDNSVLFSGAGFPTWMNPTDSMVYDWENQ